MTREEAIKEIRRMSLPKETMEILKALAPELAESEDEKVMTWLITRLKTNYKGNYWAGKAIEYLEKHKESLHISEICKENADSFTDSIIEVRSFQRGIEEGRRQEQEKHKEPHYTKRNALFDKCVENCDPEVMKEVSDEIDEMLKKEQKLADSEEKFESIDNAFRRGREVGFHEGVESVKLAEWSEEDERMIDTIVSVLGQYIDYKAVSGTGSGYATPRYSKEIAWLKSLRPQYRQEIYQSAKHDLAIRFMNYLDENRPDGKMGLSNGECEDIDKAFKENDWAKIMRYVEKYRPSWKPSEDEDSKNSK